MPNKSSSYTITSKDPLNYNTIRVNIDYPFEGYCSLLITNLTTKATFIVLDKNDYIEIDGIKYFFKDEYSDISQVGFSEILNDVLSSTSCVSSIDNCGRLNIKSALEFEINDMSYNVKLLTGFYNDELPMKSKNITASSVGYILLTPILYLISNLGSKDNNIIKGSSDTSYSNHKIFMKVYNSFTSNYPIINSNGEFRSTLPVNSLSDVQFKLVDSNFKDVRLLTPMYLSIQIDSIEGTDT